MIDAREIQRNLRLPGPDEVEVQRLGGEIVAILRSPEFDGSPVQYEIPVGEDVEQYRRTVRIACALQRRFQAKLWTVFLEPFVDSANPELTTKVHRLSFAIDAVATRQNGAAHTVAVAPVAVDVDANAKPLPAEPVISIIFGTFNRLALLKRAVASIRSSVGALSYEIVIADGGSTDGSREWLAAQPDVLLVAERRLDGAVRAFNQAFAVCRGEYIANFNDDARYEPYALHEAVVYLKEHPTCGQVALPFFDKSQGKRTVNDVFPRDQFPEVTWGTTYANFGVIRRAVADKIARIQNGFWWPGYRTYAGDCELSAWVWKIGGYTVDKFDGPGVEDELVADDLREKNSPDLVIDTRKMNERWPAEAFKAGVGKQSVDPKVSKDELQRYLWQCLDRPSLPNEVHLWNENEKRWKQVSIFLEPEEEARLIRLAPMLRALDPVEGCFPKRAEKLTSERILHLHINGEKNPDQQEGLFRALQGWAGVNYDMIRWLDLASSIRETEIVSAARILQPSIVFMQLQQPSAIPASTIRLLRTVVPEAVIVDWSGDIASCNSPFNVDWQVPFARLCDLTLHSSFSHVRALRAAGVHNSAWLDIGYDPIQYRPPLRAPAERDPEGRPLPIVDTNNYPLLAADDVTAYAFGDWRARYRSYDVAFLGSNYDGTDEFSKSTRWNDGPLRAEVVTKMKEAFGWKFCCYGNGWAKPGKRDQVISVNRSHEVYQRAKIGLSISLMNDLECYSSDRLHRILGCGALALVKRFPGMSVLGLEDGVNCRVWDTADEAVKIAKECLGANADPIRKAGAELARNHLTWSARIEQLQLYVDAVRTARALK